MCEFINLLILSGCTAGFTTIFRVSIQRDGVLSFYFPFLMWLFLRLKVIKVSASYLEALKGKSMEERTQLLLEESDIQAPKLMKVLGGCDVCMNTHIGWLLGFIFYYFDYVPGVSILLNPLLSVVILKGISR